MSPLVTKYYNEWLSAYTLLGHPNDEEKFYRFVKACTTYCRRSKLSGHWLRHFLSRDLPTKYADPEYIEQQIQLAVSKFDTILDYDRVKFPDHVLEMRNPFSVMFAMQTLRKGDGSSLYSQKEINKALVDNFGPNWRQNYLKRADIT